jgi:hypothetical protein
METKQLLVRGRPPERARAVGDKAVHRDAHRVGQHGFKRIAPERRRMIAMTFTIELDIGLAFLPQAARPQLVTDRETKTHRRGRSKRSDSTTPTCSTFTLDIKLGSLARTALLVPPYSGLELAAGSG